ncbi:MAG: ATP-binding protein [Candidatus Eiseniibacteriota bacterium]
MRALLVEMADWPVAARFPATLKRAGFETAVLATPGAMIRRSRYLDGLFDYPAQHLLRFAGVLTAIGSWSPDVVIPCDDEAVQALCRIREGVAGQRRWFVIGPVRKLLDRSIGPVSGFETKRTRAASLRALEASGVCVAPFARIPSQHHLRAFVEAHGLPVVLKADGSAAGQGVRVCRTLEGADAAFLDLAGRVRAEHRDRGQRLTEALLWGTDPTAPSQVSAQKFVAGREAMRTFVALGGREIDGISVSKIVRSDDGLGPATVIDFIDHPEMSEATTRLARAIGYSGFGSIDFIVEDGTNRAHAIEFNSRLTALVHLGHHVGHDLAEALLLALRGEQLETRAPARGRLTLFPREWMRDPSSPYLTECFVDVPTEEPEITKALVEYAEGKSPQHGPMNLAAFCTDPMAILRENPGGQPK